MGTDDHDNRSFVDCSIIAWSPLVKMKMRSNKLLEAVFVKQQKDRHAKNEVMFQILFVQKNLWDWLLCIK